MSDVACCCNVEVQIFLGKIFMLIDARCIYGAALSWYLNQTTHLVSDLIRSIITCLIVDPTRCTPLQQIVKMLLSVIC